MQLPLPVNNKLQYFLLLALLALGLAVLSVILSTPRVGALVLSEYQSVSCTTGAAAGKDNLQILTLTDAYVEELATATCAGEAVARDYSDVTISWRPRSFLSGKDILEGRYDLFWNREHLVLGMVPEFFDYYQPLLETPSYAVYWFSRGGLPEMTREYLEGKVVGLLDDPSSQTFYQRPMNALHEAGIELTDQQLRLYPDPHALYRAFTTGEVDIISGPIFLAERFQLAYEHQLLIEDRVTSGTWYVNRRLVGSGVECDLLAALGVTNPLLIGDPLVAEGIQCP
ncbi:hypothetical protein FV139_05845 [Parahaliea maris]|uniref:Uncharacterized protein n=1 Tax=Parahaliea maris TaxID=2716870 RepID=A0A5C9A3R0_9GAMM|nr:hypothetical protein [Parahaliea maris]TXS95408.1 hypothetical protein FV139_05845 [Parahaliea maris]